MEALKVCTKCGASKPLDAYYKTAAGNARGACKLCCNAAQKLNYESRREYYLAQHRKRANSDEARAKRRASHKRWRDKRKPPPGGTWVL